MRTWTDDRIGSRLEFGGQVLYEHMGPPGKQMNAAPREQAQAAQSEPATLQIGGVVLLSIYRLGSVVPIEFRR